MQHTAVEQQLHNRSLNGVSVVDAALHCDGKQLGDLNYVRQIHQNEGNREERRSRTPCLAGMAVLKKFPLLIINFLLQSTVEPITRNSQGKNTRALWHFETRCTTWDAASNAGSRYAFSIWADHRRTELWAIFTLACFPSGCAQSWPVTDTELG